MPVSGRRRGERGALRAFAGRLAWVLCLFGLSGIAAHGAPPAPAATAKRPPPDLELLEYLGGLESDGDEWVGPDDMANDVDVPRVAERPRGDATGRDARTRVAPFAQLSTSYGVAGGRADAR